MSTFAKIKRALSLTCVIFTIIISVMYVLGLMMSGQATLFVPTPTKALLMLLFSGILGFASLLLSKEGTSAPKLIIHAVLCLAAFILVFVVGGNFSVTGGAGIVASVFFLAVYGIVMIVRAIVCRKYRQKKVDSEEYTSVFK